MNKLINGLLIILITFCNAKSATAELKETELAPCVVITHCVLENWEVSDVQQTFKNIETVVANTPRTLIVEKYKFYIHAEAKTKWRRYTDDLIIKALPNRNIIQVRSESRIGIGDNGVNKKRIDELAYRLMTNQIENKKKKKDFNRNF